ncbi:MAG: ACP S-malonyltransferase [Pseudomonadota bacterium]
MTRTAVVICPGRGTYNKDELGYLGRHHSDKATLFQAFDAIRSENQQESIIALDGADRFSLQKHTRGDIASPLIYAASVADTSTLSDDIEIVAVTGNSMGWYIALAAGGAAEKTDGFRIVNTMGDLMQQQLIGGQIIYPFVDDAWAPIAGKKKALLECVDEINNHSDHSLALSIDLGGMLVIAGNEAGLKAFEKSVPQLQNRFPMRLPNHAAFHTELQTPVAKLGQGLLPVTLFSQPKYPLIDGRGHVWWPNATDVESLRNYTLDHQVRKTYGFSQAIQTAAREFAPDLFIVTGPGTTLGGAVAQSLLLIDWQNMKTKQDFQTRQQQDPFLISMGIPEQRSLVT